MRAELSTLRKAWRGGGVAQDESNKGRAAVRSKSDFFIYDKDLFQFETEWFG
jgi:hypothetical protein